MTQEDAAARDKTYAALSVAKFSSSSNIAEPEKTPGPCDAAIVIIGDEILNGQTRDVNTAFLAARLHSLGIRVKRVSVVPDQIDVIAAELRKFSREFRLVLTSGGIGPTHDDVTYEAAAAAFDDRLEENEYLGNFVESWFKTSDRGKPCFKLAQIPSRAALNFSADKGNRFPVVSVNGNVYIFPGIPHLLRNGFEAVCVDIFRELSTQRFFLLKCFVNSRETEIAERLNSLVARHPEVSFGSYPDLFNSYYKTKITLEATSQEIAEKALRETEDILPVVRFDGEPTRDAMEKIEAFRSACDDAEMVRALDEAVKLVEKCFQEYRPEEVVVCFNGGKDCIVMLHLIHSHFVKHFPGAKLQAFYVRERDPFDEIEDFVDRTSKLYDLDMVKLEGPMKGALGKLLGDRPALKACVLGTRDGDPGAKYQTTFSMTDGDWPRVMRVNPIFGWGYGHVWKFVRGLTLDYPALYDQGYTSLGGKNDTDRNEALKYLDADGKARYKPAYELQDGSLERKGRR